MVTKLTMPSDHLLCSFHALARAVFAGHRRLSFCNGINRGRIGNLAFEALHVHIWVSTAVGNPEPGTSTAISRACRETCWDLVCCEAFPGCANFELAKTGHMIVWKNSLGEGSEDNKILHRHSGQVGLVTDSPSCTGGHAFVLGVQLEIT